MNPAPPVTRTRFMSPQSLFACECVGERFVPCSDRISERRYRPRGISFRHRRAEFGEFLLDLRSARVMRLDSPVFRGETEGHANVKLRKRLHLAVEPGERLGAEAIRPGKSGAQMSDPQPFHPGDGIIKPRIFEIEPLANSEIGRAVAKMFERRLGRPVLAQK